MHSIVLGEFWMKRSTKAVALPDRDDLIIVKSNRLGPAMTFRDDRRTNENSRDGLVQTLDNDFIFKTVDLGTERVSAHRDVQQTQGELVFPILDVLGHEDHSHASPPDRHSRCRPLP